MITACTTMKITSANKKILSKNLREEKIEIILFSTKTFSVNAIDEIT